MSVSAGTAPAPTSGWDPQTRPQYGAACAVAGTRTVASTAVAVRVSRLIR